MKKKISIIITIIVAFLNLPLCVFTVSATNINYSDYIGTWNWEESIPYYTDNGTDNWYEYDEASVDILSVDGNKIKFLFSHQQGGVHLYIYDICEGIANGNVVTANTAVYIADGTILQSEFTMTLTLNANNIHVRVYNNTYNGITFEGLCYKKEKINIFNHYSAVIRKSYNENASSLYSLYDIDKDGILELIIDSNEEHSIRDVRFYKFNNDLISMGMYKPGYAELCQNPNGTGIITYHAYRNYQWLGLINYKDNVLVEESITESKFIDGEMDFNEPEELLMGAYRLETCSTGNNELLKKQFDFFNNSIKREITVLLNGEKISFDQPPINTPEGRLLVPIRKIAESMNKIVLWSDETKTAFIDNSTNALIIPLLEKTMYLANENGIDDWEKVSLDVPAIETNGRILVPVRAFCESLGATVTWEDDIKTAFITYDDTTVNERMNDMLFDSINLVWYIERLDALWSTQAFPFDDYSIVIDDFYINRPYDIDAVNMGLSDPFAGIQDLVSMINKSDNATNIILQSMEEIISEIPSNISLNFDAGIVKTLKEMVASGVDIYSEVGGLGYKIRSYSDAFVFLDDALLDYSKNYHSTVSGIFDLSVFTLEELAYLLTEYQTNIEYLDIFENKLTEAGYSNETIEKSVWLLRTQYTNKFIGVMLDLRSACVEASVEAVLNAGLTIAGQSTWGVSAGMLVWKSVFGITGINKQGKALKTFYGLYCIDNRLNSTFNNIVETHASLTSSGLLELRRLIELLKAEKITAYKAMKNITNWYNFDSKEEADKQIENLKSFTYRIFK